MAKALEGIKVLDFSRNYAGPLCTRILAELGADVIKLEVPQGGERAKKSFSPDRWLGELPFRDFESR